MSSTPLDLPILISQLPFVQKIAHVERAKPDIQQQLFGPMIQEQVKNREGTVQQVEKKSQTDPIYRDSRKDEKQQASSDRQQKDPDEEDPDTGASNASPWAGNIVNVKI